MNVRMMPPQGPMGQPMPMGGAPAPMGGPPPMPMGGPMPVPPMQPTAGQQNKKGLGSTFGGNAQGRGQFKNFMSAKKQTSALVPQMQPSMQPMGSAPPMAQPMAAPQPMLPGPAPQMMGAMRPMGNAQVSMPIQAGRPMRGSQGGLGSAPVQLNRGGEVEIPRRTDIYGQDHMLAYIRPDEADLLKGLGGMGTPGPGGVPQFGFWDVVDSIAGTNFSGNNPSSGSSSNNNSSSGVSDYEQAAFGTTQENFYNNQPTNTITTNFNDDDDDNTSTTVTTTPTSYVDTSSLAGISDASGIDYTGGNTNTITTNYDSGYDDAAYDGSQAGFYNDGGFGTDSDDDDDDSDTVTVVTTPTYTDTSTLDGINDASGYTGGNTNTGSSYVDTSTLTGISDASGTDYTGGDTSTNTGTDSGSTTVPDPVYVPPPTYYDMYGGEHDTQEAANAADKAYTDSQQQAIDIASQTDGQAGYTSGGYEYEGPDFDFDSGQQQSEASNNTAKLMNDYSTISDDYSTFQGNDLSTGDGNTIGYSTGGSKVGYAAVVNPVTGGIDIYTPGSESIEKSFAAEELTEALNYLTDGDVDLTNLDAPADLLAGSVTGTETGDVGLEAVNLSSIPDDALDFVDDSFEVDLFGDDDYTPTSAELAAQLEAEGLTNITPDPLSVEEQADISGGSYAFGPDRADEIRSSDLDLLAADALASGEYDDTILGQGEGGLGSDADTAGIEDVAGSFENLLNTQPVDQSQMDVIANTIRELEGFGDDTYFDVNAERAGYGSDTKTDPVTGEVTQIEPGMTVTKEEAEADLNRRLTTEFIPSVVDAVGADTFYAMDPTTQAALTSIAYNYGANWAEKLPSLAEAAKTGNTDLIADAIEDRSVDNDGINATRRLREAEMVRSGVPLGGDTDIYAEDDVALAATATGKGTGVGGADTEIVTEVTEGTGQTATEAYLSAMKKVGSGYDPDSTDPNDPNRLTAMEQQALYGARGQTPNAAETAYLNSLLRGVKHKEDGPIDNRRYIETPITYGSTYNTETGEFEGSNEITGGGERIENPNFGKQTHKAGDYVVEQSGLETFGNLIVKGIDFFLNPLTILGDKYSLENMNEAYVQEQLDAYKNGGTFVYDGAGTVVGIADANYDADGDGENDSVVLIGDDGEYTVSSGRVGVEDVDNSNQYSDTDEDIDDIDIVDSNTTFTNTEGGVLTSDPDNRKEETGDDETFVDPCPEGFVLDPVLGECVPIDEVDATAGTPSLGDVIRPDSGSGTPTPTPTPAAGEPMIIRGPKQFNVGGAVTPNIDRFMQSLGA